MLKFPFVIVKTVSIMPAPCKVHTPPLPLKVTLRKVVPPGVMVNPEPVAVNVVVWPAEVV